MLIYSSFFPKQSHLFLFIKVYVVLLMCFLIFTAGTGVGHKPRLFFMVFNFKNMEFKLCWVVPEPLASPSCWRNKPNGSFWPRTLWKLPADGTGRHSAPVLRQKCRVTSNAVRGISILRDLGGYWSPAALSAAATAMRLLFMSGGLAWLNSFAYRRMDQARKGKQICACDNL